MMKLDNSFWNLGLQLVSQVPLIGLIQGEETNFKKRLP